MTNIVAVTSKVEHAGAILMWTLRGATDLAALTRAWDAAGLDITKLPEAPTPATALRRAVNELREKHRFVRSMGKGGGFAIVKEDEDLDAGGDPFKIEMKVKLDAVGRLTVEGGGSDQRSELRESFEKHAAELSTEDVSAWLVALIPSLDGVPMRGGGGVYFIPYANLPRLNSIVDALKASTGHAIYRVPAVNESDDNSRSDIVQAILDSIEAEAADEVDGMTADLAAEKYGARGYEHRIERTDAVEAKVSRYEALVGGKLDALRGRLVSLRAALTVAVVKAQQNEEKRSGGSAQQSLANL